MTGSALSPHMLPILHQSSSEGEEEGNGRGLRHSGACRSIDLYVAHRHEHFPMLHIRPARVEDADDLMAIFIHSSTSAVTEQYGEWHFILLYILHGPIGTLIIFIMSLFLSGREHTSYGLTHFLKWWMENAPPPNPHITHTKKKHTAHISTKTHISDISSKTTSSMP